MTTHTFKIGDRVRLKNGDGMTARAGAEAIVVGRDAWLRVAWDRSNGLAAHQIDGGYGYDIFELVTPAHPPLTILDDAGRAALKVGDRVLAEMTITAERDRDGHFNCQWVYNGRKVSRYVRPDEVYALLPTAEPEKPITVGDKLRERGGHTTTFTCVGFTSDGKVVVEYQAGDDTNVNARDASCFERVS